MVGNTPDENLSIEWLYLDLEIAVRLFIILQTEIIVFLLIF